MGSCISKRPFKSKPHLDVTTRLAPNNNVYQPREPIIPINSRLDDHRNHCHPVVGSRNQPANVLRQFSGESEMSSRTNRISMHSSQYFKQTVFVALYNYDAGTSEDLSFQKGDKLTVIDDREGDWWLAVNSNQRQGYVPSNYLAKVDSIAEQPWFFRNLTRSDAMRMLFAEGNQQGSFLIRDSESRNNALAMSVRDGDGIKHYRILKTTTGLFYVDTKVPFPSMDKLIDHYSQNADGLCTRLTNVCIRMGAPLTTELTSTVKADGWEVDRRSLTMSRVLGSGHFAEVYEGRWNNVTAVAVKMLKPNLMSREDFLREATLMKKLRHKNLVRLYAVVSLDEPMLIVTELMVNGSLLNYMRAGAGKFLVEKQRIDMCAQIADGMEYLEANAYIHRDLAARNILVGTHNQVKIADFGLARLISNADDIYMAKEGTRFPIKWTSPEAAATSLFTSKSDVWSFGIVLFEVITLGQMPYQRMTNAEVLQQLDAGYRLPRPASCPAPLYNLMLQCWDVEPTKRPTFFTLRWQLDDYYSINSGREYLESRDITDI